MRRVDHLDDREIISLADEHPHNPLSQQPESIRRAPTASSPHDRLHDITVSADHAVVGNLPEECQDRFDCTTPAATIPAKFTGSLALPNGGV